MKITLSLYFLLSLVVIGLAVASVSYSDKSLENLINCGGDWQFKNYLFNPDHIDWEYPPQNPEEQENRQPGSKLERFLTQKSESHQIKRGPTNITLVYNETVLDNPRYNTLRKTLDAAVQVWQNVLDDGLQIEVGVEIVNETENYLGVTTSILIILPYSIVQYAHENPSTNKYEVWKEFKNTLKLHELFNFPPDTLWNDQLTLTPAELLLLWGRSTYETYELDKSPTTIHINDRYLPLFDLDPFDPTTENMYDLFSVVVHELGHVFGFGSGIDAIDFGVYENGTTGPYPLFSLDLFRFVDSNETDLVKGIRQADPANYSHWYSDASVQAQLSSGSYSSEYQASHWTYVNNTILGLMSPVLFRGKQMGFSINDISAFSHLGYHLNTLVPELQSYILAGDFMNITVQGFWIQDSKQVFCRFNQDDATMDRPLDRVSQNRWREVTCKIPKSLRVDRSKLKVQLSNDKGKTWSNSLKVWVEKLPVLHNYTIDEDKNQIILTGVDFSSEAYCEFLYSYRLPGKTSNKRTNLKCDLDEGTPLTDPSARVRVWQHTQSSDWLTLTPPAK